MSIIKDMDIVYDLKMADKENEIHSSNADLEKYGRELYNRMNPDQESRLGRLLRSDHPRLQGEETHG